MERAPEGAVAEKINAQGEKIEIRTKVVASSQQPPNRTI
jgi:hypothetical protein